MSSAVNGSNADAPLRHDLTRLRPDYAGGSIVNLMCSIGGAFGAPTPGYAPLTLLPTERVAAAKRVVLVVIDGLGAELLAHIDTDGPLRALQAGTMTSVYPPTTASAVTTYMTGLAPQQHGLTGWFMHFREIGAVTAILPFITRGGGSSLAAGGVPLAALVDSPSFHSRLDCRSAALLPQAIADSTFSRQLGAGADRIGYASMADFAQRLTEHCTGGRYGYTYAYWSELDHLAHWHGPSSTAVAEHFRALQTVLEPLAALSERHGTLLLITADHGFIDSGAAERVDVERHPRFAQMLSQPLCGEPRTAYCYVRASAATAFERYVKESLSTYAELVPSAELIADGWFGLGEPHPELGARIGDYALLMRERYTLRDIVAGERDLKLRGVHGGTSAAEQRVPLLIAGG